MALLEIQGLTVRYGRVTAVRDVDLHVDRGEVVAVLGPNGAGKTTLLSAITRLVTPAAGTIRFDDHALDDARTEQTARMGVALVPEGRHIFTKMTVRENLRLGQRKRADRVASATSLDDALDLFPKLRQLLDTPAGRLSGGEQQQLAIARAVLGDPRLLLLDEPSLGLAPLIIDRVFEVLEMLRARGVTIVVVEQAISKAIALADRVYVMRAGSVAWAGPCSTQDEEDEVRTLCRALYMGSEEQ